MVLERKVMVVQLCLHFSFLMLSIFTFVVFALVYLLTETIVQRYFISDTALLLIAGFLQMSVGCFLAVHTLYHWKYRDPPELCNSACAWFLFILASAILLGISIALPASVNDSSGLRNDLEKELAKNYSEGLLSFGYYEDGCCGVYYEFECQRDYPPFENRANQTISKCLEGSTRCQQPCFDVIWNDYVHPFKILVATVGFASLAIEVLEFFLPSILKRIFWRYSIEYYDDDNPARRSSIRTGDAELDQKIETFYKQLHVTYGSLNDRDRNVNTEVVHINVVRQHALEQSIDQLASQSPSKWLLKFKVCFADEEGQDYGGVLREWLTILVRQMLNPNFAMFRKVRPDGVAYTIDEKSRFINQNYQTFYKFAGLLVAKAIYEKIPVQCFLANFLYKKMLGQEVVASDLQEDDLHFYANLAGLVKLTEDELKEADLFFASDISAFGDIVQQTDLLPHTKDTPVTSENVKEYVELMCLMKMTGEIEEQLGLFLDGFHTLIPQPMIGVFTPKELELLLCGNRTVDIGEIKAYALHHECSRETPQVQWLWKALESFTLEERSKFLLFVTGSDRVPLGGFTGSDGGQQFTILVNEHPINQLPTAHTCFNRIELPRYPTYSVLRERLLKAITEYGEGFGIK